MHSERPNPTQQPAEQPDGKAENANLRRALRLSREMLALADEGERDHADSSCAILYGTLRDMAYKLRRHAEDECEKHRRAGKWD
ncbi:MAG: hypothetical protein HY907_02755 [Deltaproteobacteria bacterium]|nr:hypothetical protein [Deltaproteobacteria bacterium]